LALCRTAETCPLPTGIEGIHADATTMLAADTRLRPWHG
jgi:hypothetical protein